MSADDKPEAPAGDTLLSMANDRTAPPAERLIGLAGLVLDLCFNGPGDGRLGRMLVLHCNCGHVLATHAIAKGPCNQCACKGFAIGSVKP